MFHNERFITNPSFPPFPLPPLRIKGVRGDVFITIFQKKHTSYINTNESLIINSLKNEYIHFYSFVNYYILCSKFLFYFSFQITLLLLLMKADFGIFCFLM